MRKRSLRPASIVFVASRARKYAAALALMLCVAVALVPAQKGAGGAKGGKRATTLALPSKHAPAYQYDVLAAPAAPLIISEFRYNGPGPGASPTAAQRDADEFVEIYNNGGSDVTVTALDGSAGFALAASDGVARFTIPNGTVIPAHGHYLGCNSAGYSLASYPAGNGTTATCDATYTTDIPLNAGIALFNTANPANFTINNRMDAVGSTSEANTLYKEGAGLPALGTGFVIQSSFYRDLSSGTPKDTGDNSSDFLFVDTNGTGVGAGQRLGAPGPENLSSPINRGAQIKASLIDPGCTGNATAPTQACPRYRDTTPSPASATSLKGTLSIRRRFTNNTGANVTRLRFRIVNVTTFPESVISPGSADVRPITSSDQVAVCQGSGLGCASVGSLITINGTTLEEPPAQPNGGGYNSTLSAGTVTLGTPLAPGASINLQFMLGVRETGNFRFFVIVEALP